MSIRVKILMVFLVASMVPLAVLSLAAFSDYGTLLFYTQISLIAMVGTLLSLLIARSFSDQLLRLTDAANRIANGDFDVQLSTDSKDELGQFVRDFNRVAHQLKEQRRQLEEAHRAAEQASLLKSEFITNISHETKTPMNGILGMSELLSDTILTREQRDCLNMLQSSAESMMSILNDMLDFSRLEGGVLEVEKINFEFRDAFDDVLEPLRLTAESKGLNLVTAIHPDVPNGLVGDPGRLRQVLGNLVSNAVKFTRRGGIHVEVTNESMTDDDVLLRFRVRDTGLGIEEEKQPHIFNAFMQGDPTATRDHGGLGLGLTIAARLVQNMDGSIWMVSPCSWAPRQSDPGTEFCFTLPLGIQKKLPLWLDHETELGGRPVLLVSSHAANRVVFKNLMTDWGMQVKTCETGQEVLHLLDQEKATENHLPYTIVFDLRLPDMSGVDLALNVSRTHGFYTYRMMMVTATGLRGDVQKCKLSGIAAYLTKPVRAYEFRQAMLELLNVDQALMKSEHFLITRHSLREMRKRFRILILEPDPEEALSIEEKLLSWRHHIDHAETDREAGIRLRDRHYDVLLLGPGFQEEVHGLLAAQDSGSMAKTVSVVAGFSSKPDRFPKSMVYVQLARPFRAEQLYEAYYDILMKKESLEELPIQNPDILLPDSLKTTSGLVFNLGEALRGMDNDMDLFEEVVEIFEEDLSGKLEQIEESLKCGDFEEISDAAHTLKGSMSNFHCDKADHLVSRIEQLAREGEKQLLTGLVMQLQDVSQQLVKELRAAVGK